MKRTYYIVRSSFDDKGHVIASLDGTIEAEKRPKAGFLSTEKADVYTDYFDTQKEAEDFVKESEYA